MSIQGGPHSILVALERILVAPRMSIKGGPHIQLNVRIVKRCEKYVNRLKYRPPPLEHMTPTIRFRVGRWKLRPQSFTTILVAARNYEPHDY